MPIGVAIISPEQYWVEHNFGAQWRKIGIDFVVQKANMQTCRADRSPNENVSSPTLVSELQIIASINTK
jgi:hypothetical protein